MKAAQLSLILSICLIAFSCGAGDNPHNPTIDGFHGIWYADMVEDSEYGYVYYSGGMGTYTAKHIPLAYYAPEVDKTFFCYGGTDGKSDGLLQMAAWYDHKRGVASRPTIVVDKHTEDAHDNAALMLDGDGYVWIFAASHGQARPSQIYRSEEPYSTAAFKPVYEGNFSYPQPWYIPGRGFLFLHTRYIDGRHLYVMTSPDGYTWSEPRPLSLIEQGQYQISWSTGEKVCTAFNMHPDAGAGNWDDPEKAGANHTKSGANSRSNLYYMETTDMGETWRTASGETLAIPIPNRDNPALVHNYLHEGLLVYVKDMAFDSDGHPVILYVTSRGPESGPENAPRTWHTAAWDGREWRIGEITTSDNNYDMGSLYIGENGEWSVIAPTIDGPQAYNSGGEVALWESEDRGDTWRTKALTRVSEYNHSYVRKPVNADDGFYAFWVDGHGRIPSPSRLFFYDRRNDRVYRLPEHMKGDTAPPDLMTGEE